jgi:hypothetical protein
MHHPRWLDSEISDLTTLEELPLRCQQWVQRELESREQVVWAAMPRPRFFTPGATGAFLFGIPWTAFAVFWTTMAAWGVGQAGGGQGPVWAFPLFGVPFILIGVGMLSSPLWAYRKAAKTVYAITDRRAITFEGGRSITIRSYRPDRLQDVYRREYRDGTGDILIDRRAWRDSDGDKQFEEFGFLRVAQPKEVEALLKQLAAQAANRERTE